MTTIRRLLWVAGTPVRWVILALIGLYQVTLSPSLGGQCRFYPSCSEYGREAIEVHGAVKGSVMAAWRILRCGPFTGGGFDPVPKARARCESYESVIHSHGRAGGVEP